MVKEGQGGACWARAGAGSSFPWARAALPGSRRIFGSGRGAGNPRGLRGERRDAKRREALQGLGGSGDPAVLGSGSPGEPRGPGGAPIPPGTSGLCKCCGFQSVPSGSGSGAGAAPLALSEADPEHLFQFLPALLDLGTPRRSGRDRGHCQCPRDLSLPSQARAQPELTLAKMCLPTASCAQGCW